MDDQVKRYKAEVGVEDFFTRRHGVWISEAVETDIVLDGTRMLRIGSILFAGSAEWRHTRRHAAQDVIVRLQKIVAEIEQQIDEFRTKECAA
jgi:hypothetical protein